MVPASMLMYGSHCRQSLRNGGKIEGGRIESRRLTRTRGTNLDASDRQTGGLEEQPGAGGNDALADTGDDTY